MDARTRLAELELMEKLATLEADEPESASIQKEASVPGDRTAFLQRVGGMQVLKRASDIVTASRRAGRARAEAEIAQLLAR